MKDDPLLLYFDSGIQDDISAVVIIDTREQGKTVQYRTGHNMRMNIKDITRQNETRQDS